MNTMSIRIRYKQNGSVVKASIQFEEDRVSCEVLARLFAEELTRQYSKYIGGKKSMKELKRYEFGQYKLVLYMLEKRFL